MADKTLDELASEINELTSVTDDDSVSRGWRIIRNSQRDCSCCGKCGKPIASGEAVWRFRVTRNSWLGGYNHNLAACCQACAENDWHSKYLKPKQCSGCGRIVNSELQLQWSAKDYGYLTKPVTCCEACGHKVRLAKQRRKRTDTRGTRECQECGETFEPARTNSRFCSAACKQRAYRKRVTDDATVLRRRRKSRNGSDKQRAPQVRTAGLVDGDRY
jgi:hypothetical protein